MAEYLAFQPHVKFSLYRNRVTKLCFASQDIHTKTMRCCYYPGCRKVTQLSSWKVRVPRGIGLAKPNASHHHQKSPVKCFCFGSLINTDGVASGWIPVVDKVLLLTSIFLTYTAGVIPVDRSIRVSPENILKDSSAPADPTFSGSAMDHDHEVNSKLTWDAVKDKIGDSLNAIEGGFNLGNKTTEMEQDHAKRLSNICAVAEGPMFRLLWASFQRLKEEVDNITGSSLTLEMDDMQIILSDIIQRSLPSVCIDWLRAEVCLTNRKSAKELPTTIVERLNGYESISQNIIKSGKEGLYSELICFLRFGSLRQGCYYDYSFFTRHGVSILEDFVITLADGIAGLYLELISIDSDISNEINSLGLSLCTLSTRALQRLRNEVALKQWLYQNMDAVVSMYEDRFDLCTLQSLLIEEPSKSDTEKFSWLKKLSLRKSGPASSSFRVAVLSYICVPVKRTKELRVLGGWRYYFSLYLELADITMPLIRTLVSKVSDAISFFLVCLIGRSLGLIYTGIRQSLRWK